jgi:hypothetical protein
MLLLVLVFEEVFAPVARMESVRVMLAMAAHHGWTVHHMDVKSAFLNGDLAEEVYVQRPPGFVVDGQDRKVLRLHKALYGLRQAPRVWNSKLYTVLNELMFLRCKSEHDLYTRMMKKMRLVVRVYVDDLIIMGESEKEVQVFKEEMERMFGMSDLGSLSFYLGIEVKQLKSGIELCHNSYAIKLLEKARMNGCNPCTTSMEARLKLSKVGASAAVNSIEYRSLISSLRYLLHTRPDLTFSMCYLSQFMEEPRQEHLATVKECFITSQARLNLGSYIQRGVVGAWSSYAIEIVTWPGR